MRAGFDFEIQHGDNRETAISSPAWTWNVAWVSGLLLQDGLHKMERDESGQHRREKQTYAFGGLLTHYKRAPLSE